MITYFDNGEGIVAILDATNSTRGRRAWVRKRCEEAHISTLYVESKCDDEQLIMSNIMEVKTTSPDYKGQDPEAAAKDFRNRIRNYERVYQSIDEADTEQDLTYVKIIDVGARVIINNIRDYLQSRVVYYLMNLHIKPRSIWLSRHGESIYNLQGKIGGDSSISHRGEAYARALPSLVAKSVPATAKLQIWTSTLRRTIQTARWLAASNRGYTTLEWKALDELDSGVCDGLTYQEIASKFPDDFAARDEDKYNYRYRGGESYRDVVIRLEPIIMELERSENVIIVTHQAVLRCIYAYYMNVPQEKSPWMEVPLHTLIKLTPRAYHTQEERFAANIPAVSTFREKGTAAKHQEGEDDAGVGELERQDIEKETEEERRRSDGDLEDEKVFDSDGEDGPALGGFRPAAAGDSGDLASHWLNGLTETPREIPKELLDANAEGESPIASMDAAAEEMINRANIEAAQEEIRPVVSVARHEGHIDGHAPRTSTRGGDGVGGDERGG